MSEAPIDVVELAATVESLVNQTHQLQAEVRQRPLKVTTQQFEELVDCPLTAEAYAAMIHALLQV